MSEVELAKHNIHLNLTANSEHEREVGLHLVQKQAKPTLKSYLLDSVDIQADVC